MVEGGGAKRWWQRVVPRGGGKRWWQRVVVGGGNNRWCQGVVVGGGGRRWWQRVVAGGGGKKWWWEVCIVWLSEFVPVVVVAVWIGLVPSFFLTCSSSFQLTIIWMGFIVVPPSSWPTSRSILIISARSGGITSLAWQTRRWW